MKSEHHPLKSSRGSSPPFQDGEPNLNECVQIITSNAQDLGNISETHLSQQRENEKEKSFYERFDSPQIMNVEIQQTKTTEILPQHKDDSEMHWQDDGGGEG